MAASYADEANWAVSVIAEALRLPVAVQAELAGKSLTKSDSSPVTVADFGVQAVVARRLRERFPQAVLVGEEDAAELRTPANDAVRAAVAKHVGAILPGATEADVCRWIDEGSGAARGSYWTLDPIDGTKGFLRGDQYALALAYIVDGQVMVGVLGCPNLDETGRPAVGKTAGSLYWAVRGQGTFVRKAGSTQDVRLNAAATVDPTRARLLASFESGHTDDDNLEKLRDELASTAPYVRMDSQAKYAVLASGGAELLFRLLSPKRPDYKEKIWDQAAGMLVVQEAGGKVTDLSGKPLDFSHGDSLSANRGVLASNGPLHDLALAAVKKLGA